MPDIRIKRGSLLGLLFAFGNPDGTPWNAQSASMTFTVADPRGNVLASAELGVLQPNITFALTGVAGQASVSIYSTANWPEGLMQADLLVSVNGMQVISQSFGIRVERPVVQIAPDPAAYNPVLAP
jgi:hypothetical protein